MSTIPFEFSLRPDECDGRQLLLQKECSSGEPSAYDGPGGGAGEFCGPQPGLLLRRVVHIGEGSVGDGEGEEVAQRRPALLHLPHQQPLCRDRGYHLSGEATELQQVQTTLDT